MIGSLDRFRNWTMWCGTICLIVTAAGALAAAEPNAPSGVTPPAQRPNVLFIAVDDLNDWVGTLDGYEGVQTPNLDRLAGRGVLFTRAYCSAPACNPSRASLMCGIRPSTSGVYHNDQPWRPVLPNAVTLSQHFMANGYEVAGGGKIFHYNEPASWQTYQERKGDPRPPVLPANGIPKAAHFDWGPVDVPDAEMGDMKVTDWAVEFLKRDHDRPFFLAVGLFRPHLPWFVPRKYFERYPLEKIVLPKARENDLDDVPPPGRQIAKPEGDHRRVLETHNWEKAVQGYLASITFADACIGRLIEALDAAGCADDTIIVLWGDHGWHLGEKLHWRKFTLWEEATRVPLMIVAPGVSRNRVRCGRTVSLLDLYPTLIELCGLPPRPELEGTSLVKLLRDPEAPWDRPAVMTHGRNNHAVRSERWRYIRYADGTEELYDHERDPMEWTNLAGDPEHAQIKAELTKWLPKVNAEDAPRNRRSARASGEPDDIPTRRIARPQRGL